MSNQNLKNLANLEDSSIACLLGGAIGDALGYAIEFKGEDKIKQEYGFVKTFVSTPLISDDTQMTLYTAVNLLFALTRGITRGVGGDPRDMHYLASSYLRWYEGQTGIKEGAFPSFLRYIPYLNDSRAPGITCTNALEQYKATGKFATIDHPFNTSKGCGGVMRVAPIGLFFARCNLEGRRIDIYDAARTGADAAALTHGHPLGYIPAAYLSCLIYMIVHPKYNGNLFEKARRTLLIIKELYGDKKHFDEFEEIIHNAIRLSQDESIEEIDAIHRLGEGWVGEEAMAISLYCCLRHPDSFAKAIQYAVNHKGDSDSTGAIAGNIMGAYLGTRNIHETFPDYYKVEFYDLIVEIGSDLVKEIKYEPKTEDDHWMLVKYNCDAPKEVFASHWARFRSAPPNE